MSHQKLIKILHPNRSEVSVYSAAEFEQAMQLTFLPNLAFSEAKVFDKVVKICKKAEKKELFSRSQKWLGALFGEEIERGGQVDCEIRWINERIGYGVFAVRDLPPFVYIGEYTGVVRKRKRDDLSNHYCFDYSPVLGKKSPFVIDAEKQGNITRFINHSTNANLTPASVYSNKILHVVLMSKRWIKAGEQLTYDYGEEYWKKRRPPLSFD